MRNWAYRMASLPGLPKGKQRFVTNCLTTGAVQAVKGHFVKHRRDHTLPCLRSRLELSAFSWCVSRGISTDNFEEHRRRWEQHTILDGDTHRVYFVRFHNGDIYFGVTIKTLEQRMWAHRRQPGVLRDLLEADALLPKRRQARIHLLQSFDNYFHARLLEDEMILKGNARGRIINQEGNPWNGQPGPHIGAVRH